MPHEIGVADHLGFSTVRVRCLKESGRESTGTAFFFHFLDGGHFSTPALVTNWHVVDGARTGVLSLTERAADGSPRIGIIHQLTLDDFESLWIPHPDPSVDLCVLPIGGLLNEWEARGVRLVNMGFAAKHIPDIERLEMMAALEPVVMVGYPVGIWDDQNNMPVFRKGVAATHPYLDYRRKKEFIVDMACFPGSSGSPVVFVRSGLYSDKMGRNIVGSEVKLLGVLYAGPQYTVQGTIEVVPVPTALQPVPVSRIPTNLGFVIKAERLLRFEPILERLQGGFARFSPPAPGLSTTIVMPLTDGRGAADDAWRQAELGPRGN